MNMFDVIQGLHKVLGIVKDFNAGYKGSHANRGYMMMYYKGKKYAVKVVEMDEHDQAQDGFDALDNVPKYFK